MHHRDARGPQRVRFHAGRGGHRVYLHAHLGGSFGQIARCHTAHDERSTVEFVPGGFKRILGGFK